MDNNYMKTILSGVKEWTENLTDDAIDKANNAIDKANNAIDKANNAIDKALFVVNITENRDGTFSADKTYSEIARVYSEGKYNIVAVGNGVIMPLSAMIEENMITFGGIFELTYGVVVITPDNEVLVGEIPLATTDSKLPNPQPLTFTGAVSEAYDGSSAKTIEIPSGGGTSEKEWWLLRTISITESVSSVSISQDDNGDAFAIEDIFMYAPKSVTTSGSSQLIVRFNGNEGKSTSLNDFFNTNKKSFIYESYWSGRRVFRMGSSTYDFQSAADSTIAMRVDHAPKKINKIDLSLQTGQTFTAGTIYIYAR